MDGSDSARDTAANTTPSVKAMAAQMMMESLRGGAMRCVVVAVRRRTRQAQSAHARRTHEHSTKMAMQRPWVQPAESAAGLLGRRRARFLLSELLVPVGRFLQFAAEFLRDGGIDLGLLAALESSADLADDALREEMFEFSQAFRKLAEFAFARENARSGVRGADRYGTVRVEDFAGAGDVAAAGIGDEHAAGRGEIFDQFDAAKQVVREVRELGLFAADHLGKRG